MVRKITSLGGVLSRLHHSYAGVAQLAEQGHRKLKGRWFESIRAALGGTCSSIERSGGFVSSLGPCGVGNAAVATTSLSGGSDDSIRCMRARCSRMHLCVHLVGFHRQVSIWLALARVTTGNVPRDDHASSEAVERHRYSGWRPPTCRLTLLTFT